MSASTTRVVPASLWDRLGIGLSGLCAVHCLVMPLALVALPFWPAGAALHAWMHPVLAVVLVPTTLLAMRAGRRRGAGPEALGLLAVGLVVVLTALMLHEALGTAYETAATTAGGALLIAGHWRNVRAAHG